MIKLETKYNSRLMSQQPIFIELGSSATKVLRSEDRKPIAFFHPFDLIGSNGNINIKIFKKAIFFKLKRYFKEHSSGNKKIIAFATGIYRTANNSPLAYKILASINDLEIITLNPKQESIYSMLSYFKHQKELSKDIIYIDMGGGSTEIAHFENKILKECISLNIGLLFLTARLFEEEGTTDIALQKLNTFFDSHFNLHLAFFDKLNTRIKQGNCSIVITGMIAKKMAKKYRTDKLTIPLFGNYINELQSKALVKNDIQDLKIRYLESYPTRRKIDNYIGSGYLFFLLQRFPIDAFYINNSGLSDSFDIIYRDFIKKALP